VSDSTVRQYMTPVPLTVDIGDPIDLAHRMMRAYGIRHLPVLQDHKLAGVVSERDLYFVDRLDPEAISVREAMTSEAYAVPPDASLQEVIREMADSRYGSAVVVEHGQVVGIFTTVDALEAFADHLAASDEEPRLHA
jgi:acetoin utilization protein AcuB